MELTDEQKKSLLGQGFIVADDGVHFACRVLIPQGKMTAQAAQKITEVSQKYGRGYFGLTQRSNVEIPWLKHQDLETVAQELSEAGLVIGGTGPRVRPGLICKAPVCKRSLVDTEELAQVIDQRFYRGYYNVMLPNKLRIVVSGCPNGCSKPRVACIGLQGKAPNQVAVSIGGMLGKDQAIGREIRGLYSTQDALAMIEKAILYYRDKGLKGERFAGMVERIGFEVVEAHLCG